MRKADITYRINGTQQVARKTLDGITSLNFTKDYFEAFFNGGRVFYLPSSVVVSVEGYDAEEEKEADDNGEQESQRKTSPADGEGQTSSESTEATS